jgi:hypothetical protein
MRILLGFALLLMLQLPSDGSGVRIAVGPNVLVSRESNFPKVEMMVAANPKNPKNLIGTAIGSDPLRDGCKVYASFDGGNSWKEISVQELPKSGSGDPQVAFAPDGAAYFSALGLVLGDDGKDHFVVNVFRSEDGGLNWHRPSVFGSGSGPDHDQMATDPRSEYAGRIYVSVLHHSKADNWNIGVFRSDDGGKTFSGPLHVTTGAGRGVFSLNPLVFSDGTLFVPYESFEPKPIESESSATRDIYFALSTDAGATFSPPAKIRTQMLDLKYHVGSPYANVLFAADTSNGQFHDRVYMVWGEAHDGHYHLKFSYSQDRGKSWSAVRGLDNSVRPDINQFRPAIAVNNKGVIGISWFDTRDVGSRRAYDEYFAASLDGGDSFLPPVKVSSQESALDAPGNTVLKSTIDSPNTSSDGVVHFYFSNTAEEFPDGGDYMGLAASSDGVFHPFWADARTGNFQAWTAPILVDFAVHDAIVKLSPAPSGNPIPLAGKLQPVFDPASYDLKTGIEEIPIRLKNISDFRICKPITIQLKGSASAQPEATKAAQILLNADNDKEWSGAVFNYSNTLGDFLCLEPGAVSGAITWRIKVPNPASAFVSFDVVITAIEGSNKE